MRASQVPYTWDEIEKEIRRAIMTQASILFMFGPADGKVPFEVVQRYLGVDFEIEDPTQDLTREQVASIQLERHGLHRHVRQAYLYAYQLEGAENVTSAEHYEISCGLLTGFPQTDFHGEPSPLCQRNDFPLRRMLETFVARWNWNEYGHGLTIRELALLANMTPPAVRTSLSKEGFKLSAVGSDRDEDRSSELSAGDAVIWLSRRRGYIPNRAALAPHERERVVAEILDNRELDFPSALERILEFTKVAVPELAQATGRPESWVTSLCRGELVEIDLAALRAMACTLSAPEPGFVGGAIQHLLRVEGNAA